MTTAPAARITELSAGEVDSMNKNRRLASAILCVVLALSTACVTSSCRSYPNKSRVRKVLERYYQFKPNTQSTARDIMLDIFANGRYAQIINSGPKDMFPAMSYVTGRAGMRGWAVMRTDVPAYPRFVEYAGKEPVETSPDMFIGILASAGLDTDYMIITTTGQSPTFRDYMDSSLVFKDPDAVRSHPEYVPGQNGNELGWTLVAIADFGSTELKWPYKDIKYLNVTNDQGIHTRLLSIADFLDVALSRPNGWGPSAGLDELYGIAEALHMHRFTIAKQKLTDDILAKKPNATYDEKDLLLKEKLTPITVSALDLSTVKLDGTWIAAQKRIDQVISLARKNQMNDGTFSSTWFANQAPEQNPVLRTRYTARMLDVLITSLPPKELSSQWMANAVKALCILMDGNKDDIRKDTLTMAYAVHALRLYDLRTPGGTPPENICDGKVCTGWNPSKLQNPQPSSWVDKK